MKRDVAWIAAGTCIALLVSFLVVGNIPAGNGAGWDGGAYLNYVEAIGNGHLVGGDFYRLSRLSGFVPLIVASALGFSHERLIEFQTALNIVVVSASLAIFCDALVSLGVRSRVAIVSTLTVLASWSVLVIPVFYPVLSDNVAFPLSCLALWLWSKGRIWPLHFLIAIGLWIMPGLFLVPLVFAAIPRDMQNTAFVTRRGISRAEIVVFILSACGFLGILIVKLSPFLTDAELQRSLSDWGHTTISELLPLTFAMVIATGLAICWITVRLVLDKPTVRGVVPSNLCFAGISLSVSGALMWIGANSLGGYAPPEMLHFMTLQTLAVPFKPLVSHFAYFGPIVLLALAHCFRWSFGSPTKAPRALLVLVIGFLPMLAFGSESRQWIAIFPITAAIVALSDDSLRERLLCLAFSILLIVPMFWLRASTAAAIADNVDFQHPLWQSYFGRSGPWMSVETYGLFLIVMIVYFALVFAVQKSAPSLAKSSQA